MNQALILLTDDDEDDRFFIRQALEKVIKRVSIKEANNGKEALDFLTSLNEANPDLILLDVNMPMVDGLEALQIIRNSKLFQYIPIVILSTSDAPEHVRKAYELGANSYIRKPTDLNSYDDIAKAIDYCFLTIRAAQPIQFI